MVARSFVDVGDGLIRRELGIHGEIGFPDDALIGAGGAEGFSVEDVGALLDLQAHDGGVGNGGGE